MGAGKEMRQMNGTEALSSRIEEEVRRGRLQGYVEAMSEAKGKENVGKREKAGEEIGGVGERIEER